MDYAEGYGVIIAACPPHDPKKKGIVESGVKFVKRGFIPLREFRDIPDANRQAREWCLGEAGNRIHGTTRQRPLTRQGRSCFHRTAMRRPLGICVSKLAGTEGTQAGFLHVNL
jgi:hypothetical protein